MKLSRITARLLLASLLALGFCAPAYAATSKNPASTSKKSGSSSSTTKSSDASSSGQISTTSNNVQGYAATAVLQVGTIVQLTNSQANQVGAATQANQGHMYGVTVDPHSLSVTISNTALTNEAYVATDGTWNTLVSNQAGPIKVGDYVTLSSVSGVAMEAGDNGGTVFGRAAASYNGTSDSIGTVSLKDTNGQTDKSVNIGEIPVTINIRSNPNQKSTKANVPHFLQRIGLAIAEKPVSAFRIYLSTAITVLTIIVAIAMLSSGVRSSIFSIGRNPLSKKTILRALFSVILASLIILTIGLFAVYLILKL